MEEHSCQYEDRWKETFTAFGRLEGKLDVIGKQINGTLGAMEHHIDESTVFRNQVTINKVWVVIYRWILGFVLGGSIGVWFYLIQKNL